MVDWDAIIGAFPTIAGVITAVGVITAGLKKLMDSSVGDGVKPLETKMDLMRGDIQKLESRVGTVEFEARKNFLVHVIDGIKNGTPIDSATKLRFYENYDEYVKSGGNTYIKEDVERLQHDGKL